MAMQISGVTIQGGMNILPAGGSPSPTPSFSFQGSNFGYIMGGYVYPGPSSYATNAIQKYSYASDGNGSDSGDLMQETRYAGGGNSSSSSGYLAGARTSATTISNKIEKFPFVSGGNTTSSANLTNGGSVHVGYSSSSDGYTYGGETGPNGANMLKTDKFSFASDTDSTDLGNLNSVNYFGGCTSSDSGFIMGGRFPLSTYLVDITKFAFASDRIRGCQSRDAATR